MEGLRLPKEGVYVIWDWSNANGSESKTAEDPTESNEPSDTETLLMVMKLKPLQHTLEHLNVLVHPRVQMLSRKLVRS